MPKGKYPITAAVRVLREAGIEIIPALYGYEKNGGTRVSSKALGVDEHSVIKTLVMEDESKQEGREEVLKAVSKVCP